MRVPYYRFYPATKQLDATNDLNLVGKYLSTQLHAKRIGPWERTRITIYRSTLTTTTTTTATTTTNPPSLSTQQLGDHMYNVEMPSSSATSSLSSTTTSTTTTTTTSSPSSSEEFLFYKRDMIQCDSSFRDILIGTILSSNKYAQRHMFYVEGEMYQLGDFVIRLGSLFFMNMKRGIVIDIEYGASMHCYQAEKPLIEEFLNCFVDQSLTAVSSSVNAASLTVPAAHGGGTTTPITTNAGTSSTAATAATTSQPMIMTGSFATHASQVMSQSLNIVQKPKIYHLMPIRVDFSEFNHFAHDRFSSRHTALQYIHLCSQLMANT